MCRWVRIRWLNVDLIWEKIVEVGNHYLGLFYGIYIGVQFLVCGI
jgi:hypothetical protein